ncbi:MAG: ABC transporter permease [Candidatus Thermoplasmatota archaeon]|nr:ABC transporter permease [Candidatus Thermoplasmatota archaeon]
MIYDNIIIALKNIRERKTRVFLTLLGIAIGIMAIVSLMSIGEGMEVAITQELSSLSDTIFVTIGVDAGGALPTGGGLDFSSMEYLTDRDIGDLQRIQGIRDISPILTSSGIIEYNNKIRTVSLLGMDPLNMKAVFGLESLGLKEGSFLNEGDQNKCLIGHNIAYKYFDNDISVGSRIKINDKLFFVSGIYKEEGMGFSTQTDNSVHLTQRDFEKLTGETNVSAAIIRVYDVNMVNIIADEIETAINHNHRGDDVASVVTMTSILESIQSVLAIIQTVLIAIAAIALLVASIGIMNTMLTSVMERTHEIGVMKAIGAKNSDVMSIFLFEGMFISLLGGISGVIIGIIGAQGFSLATSQAIGGMLQPVFTLFSISLGIAVAILVGMISSFYPARKAAKMSPIEAVRYE